MFLKLFLALLNSLNYKNIDQNQFITVIGVISFMGKRFSELYSAISTDLATD